MFTKGQIEKFYNKHFTPDEQFLFGERIISTSLPLLRHISGLEGDLALSFYQNILVPEHTVCFLQYRESNNKDYVVNAAVVRTIDGLKEYLPEYNLDLKDIGHFTKLFDHVLENTISVHSKLDADLVAKSDNDILLIVATAESLRWDLFSQYLEFKEHILNIQEFSWRFIHTGRVFTLTHIAETFNISIIEAKRKNRFSLSDLSKLLDLPIGLLIDIFSGELSQAYLVYEKLHQLAKANEDRYPITTNLKSNISLIYKVASDIYKKKS